MGLDLYLVLTLRMGVAGVAWATLIAQGVSAVAAFLLFVRELRAYDAPSAVCFDVRELKNMARVALPSVFQQSTVSIGMMLVQSVVNSFGAETLAGYSAAMRIESICTVPMAAVGNAMSSYTAQNIGAGEYSRVRRGYRACYGILAVFALVIFAALQCFSQQLIALFLNAESSRLALETGTSCIRFLGWFYILIGLKMATDGVLRGAGGHGRVYRSKSCQPDAARGSGGSAGAPAGHPDGMVRGACGLGGQLPYLVFALPNGPLAGARRRAAGLTAAEKSA